MTTELNTNQKFHLAYATKDAFTSKYGGRVSGRTFIISNSQKAILARIVKRGYGKLERDNAWSYFVPDRRCVDHLRKYKPDTPERQVLLWDLKSPQLRTLAKFINEHLGDKYEAKLEDWDYTPQTHLFGNVSSFGRTRHGKRLVVWPKRYQDRDRYPLVTVNGADPGDYNERAVRWLMEKMKIKKP